MSARVVPILALFFFAPLVADEQIADPALPLLFREIQLADFEGGRRFDLIAAPVVGYALPRSQDGTRQLFLLTRAD